MFAYFIQTPAIGGVFIAGFLAPRASWLLGAIVGFLSAICYSILIVAFPTMIPGAAALPTDRRPARSSISALILSPIIGSFFAAGAAWYRRFLALSSPNRGAQAEPDRRSRSRATARAGPRDLAEGRRPPLGHRPEAVAGERRARHVPRREPS